MKKREKVGIRSSRNYTGLNELIAEKDAKGKEVKIKMERWMYLNGLVEQIEAQR